LTKRPEVTLIDIVVLAQQEMLKERLAIDLKPRWSRVGQLLRTQS
jgi:hypothetical protein